MASRLIVDHILDEESFVTVRNKRKRSKVEILRRWKNISGSE
jgi:hypothetical protein